MVTEVIYFSNELDLLEAHLEHHRPWGWRTVIVEGNTTIVGTQKPLVFADNAKRFERFDVEYLHLPEDLFEPRGEQNAYRAMRINDWKKRQYVHETFDFKNPWVLHGDVDEIIANEPTDYDDGDYVAFLLDERSAQVNLRVRHTVHVFRMVRSTLPVSAISRPVKSRSKTFRGGWHFMNCPSAPEDIVMKAECRYWYFDVDCPQDVPGVEHFAKMFGKPYDYITGGKIDDGQIVTVAELPPWMQQNLDKFPVNYGTPLWNRELPASLQRNIEAFSNES